MSTLPIPEPVSYPIAEHRAWWERLNVKLILFNAGVLPLLILLYWQINSVGLRFAIPSLGAKLHKFVLFTWMGRYKGWSEFDWANLAAIGQFALVWGCSVILMRFLVFGTLPGNPENAKFTRHFLTVSGTTLLVWDSMMFYLGITDQGWLSNGGSVRSIIVTAGWMAGLAVLAFFEVILQQRSES